MDVSKNIIPRALIVDISANFGGANARVLSLIKNLPRDRIGLATINGSRIAPELKRAGYQVHYLAESKFDPRIPMRLAHVVRELDYHIVDTQNPQSKLWGSIGAFLGGACLVSTLNSWYMNEHPKYSIRWFVYSMLEFLTNFALSRYIVVSREIQQDMIYMGIPEGKIDLIYNAVHLEVSDIHADKKRLLEKFQWAPTTIICFAAGRLVWAKAHDDLISALEMARRKNPNLCCLIAGEGVLYDRLKEQINQLDLEDWVVLAGHLEHKELLATLKSCDIYVMPSRTEGTPIALLEAAMLSKPIVASRVGGIPELVTDEEHALLFESGDIEALSNKILRLAEDASEASKLGAQAHAHIESSFSLAVQVRATTEAYCRAFENSKFYNKKKV